MHIKRCLTAWANRSEKHLIFRWLGVCLSVCVYLSVCVCVCVSVCVSECLCLCVCSVGGVGVGGMCACCVTC